MLDAYTLKKVLPRLVIAVILVNISWYICISLMETTNAVGGAIKELMWAPFVDAGFTKTVSVGGQLALLLWAGGTLAAIPAALWLTLGGGWAVLLTGLLSVLAALFLAIVILILREIVLVFLVIISPLAFVLWILPGTEQWAKRWWGLFTKLLLMFPAFMGLLAIGEIMSSVMNETHGGPSAGIIHNIVGLVMYIIPFFMLPFLFKAMGGFLGQITGMINDREKGLLDRSKNWSKDKTSTSTLRAEKDRRKAFGVAERKRAGDSRVLNRPRTRWQSIQNAATRGRLGQGVGDTDIAVLRGEEAQERLRGAAAEEKTKGILKSAAELDLNRVMKKGELGNGQPATFSDGTVFSPSNRDHQLKYAEEVASGKILMGDTAEEQSAARSISRTYLANNKGTKQLENVRFNAVQQALAGDDTALNEWNGYINSGGYDEMRKASAHLSKNINLSKLQSDPSLTGLTGAGYYSQLGNLIGQQDIDTLTKEGAEVMAGQTKATWERLKLADSAKAQAMFDEVMGNDNLKGRVGDDVKSLF